MTARPYEYRQRQPEVGGGRAPEWDAENRIAAIGRTRFEYDAFGERVLKTSPQGTSLYPFGDDYEITNGVVTKYFSVEGLGVIAKPVTGGPEARHLLAAHRPPRQHPGDDDPRRAHRHRQDVPPLRRDPVANRRPHGVPRLDRPTERPGERD